MFRYKSKVWARCAQCVHNVHGQVRVKCHSGKATHPKRASCPTREVNFTRGRYPPRVPEAVTRCTFSPCSAPRVRKPQAHERVSCSHLVHPRHASGPRGWHATVLARAPEACLWHLRHATGTRGRTPPFRCTPSGTRGMPLAPEARHRDMRQDTNFSMHSLGHLRHASCT